METPKLLTKNTVFQTVSEILEFSNSNEFNTNQVNKAFKLLQLPQIAGDTIESKRKRVNLELIKIHGKELKAAKNATTKEILTAAKKVNELVNTKVETNGEVGPVQVTEVKPKTEPKTSVKFEGKANFANVNFCNGQLKSNASLGNYPIDSCKFLPKGSVRSGIYKDGKNYGPNTYPVIEVFYTVLVTDKETGKTEPVQKIWAYNDSQFGAQTNFNACLDGFNATKEVAPVQVSEVTANEPQTSEIEVVQ